MCICVTVFVKHVTAGTLRTQKRTLDPLELKLQTAVSPQVGEKTPAQVI